MKLIEIIELVNPDKVNSTCKKHGDVFISKDSKYFYISVSNARKEGFKVSKVKVLGCPIRLRMSTNKETFN